MKISYLGHACFKVVGNKGSIVFDPYEDNSVPGLKLINVESDMVSCSHEHADHNAKEKIKLTGNVFDYPIEKINVPHDEAEGTLRGMSDITIVNMDGKKIIHYGDIGRNLTNDEIKKLSKADVVMIPCGGHYTIDAEQSKKIIEQTSPILTILMHYRKENIGYDVLSDIEEIKKVMLTIKEVDKDEIDSNDYEGIITMGVRQ